MKNQIYLIVLLLALVTVIPTASAQLSLGTEANQKLIEVKLNTSEIVNVKHVIAASNMPVNVNLFDGVISESITVTNGNGVEKDYAKAAKLLQEAAIEGFGNAQFLLGVMYYEGLHFEKHARLGAYWIKLAKEDGHEMAQEIWDKFWVDN